MWKEKPLHNYLHSKVEADEGIENRATAEWMNTGLSSHVEGYVAALQEQEISTRATIKRRLKDQTLPVKCRLCNNQDETVFHVLGSCSSLSSNMYTTSRHDAVGKVILQEIIDDNHQKFIKSPPPVTNTTTKEIWWNLQIKTTNKVKYNRPDIIVWDKETQVCSVIEVGVPLDFNVTNRQITKVDKYMPLVSELQQMYPEYKYQIVPIIIGLLVAIPKQLKDSLTKLQVKEKRIQAVTKKLQKSAVFGSVKTMKTFMKM